MRESAFVDPPWLLDRNGEGYIQVTELLYRIAGAMDGQRDYAAIAESVSEATGRSVTDDNVRQLVLTQLLQRGLVPDAQGRVLGGAGGSRSMLQIQMRTRLIDGKTLDPLIRIVKILFWPPVLVVATLAAMAGEVWLYAIHGVASSLREALYVPGVLLAMIAVTALAAGFHELGHAAGLRYGGGRARSMGVGFYIVYPAFFTDVSDNYRLGRWARVRTDLGGIYFHLLVALAAMGVYAATRWEPLLLVVGLLNLDVIRQLMPFVRLDGYWILADLTGVPDFFSRIAAVAKRLRPGKDEAPAPALPELKWWGKAVFSLYALVTVPLLALGILTMLRGAPRVLATAWDSGSQQGASLTRGLASGNVGEAVLGLGQLLGLALPSLAILLSLYRFGKRILVGLWHWSQPSTGRRVVAGAGLAVVLGGLAYAWAPDPRAAQNPPSGAGQGTVNANRKYVPLQPEERGTVGEVFGVAPGRDPLPPVSTATPQANPGAERTSPTAEPPGIATAAPVAVAAETAGTSNGTGTSTPTPPPATPTPGSGGPTATVGGAPAPAPAPAPVVAPTAPPTPRPTLASAPARAPAPAPTSPPATDATAGPTDQPSGPVPATSPALTATPTAGTPPPTATATAGPTRTPRPSPSPSPSPTPVR